MGILRQAKNGLALAEVCREHGISSGTHGTALYTELLHVPFIIYVPNNPPHLIDGAVTTLDIIPTVAELAGINVKDLSFEGRSLVPQIFYGKADPKRIVFAETNAPQPQRAAISEAYRYIYYLQNNVAEFYDLKADPRQLTNLAPAGAPPWCSACSVTRGGIPPASASPPMERGVWRRE